MIIDGPHADQGTSLLILQGTPFCNINCDYCYLPDRSVKSRMSIETVRAALQNLAECGLLRGILKIVWHSGEPLTLPPEYYQAAIDVAEEFRADNVEIQYHIQTNGMLISEEYCKLFLKNAIAVGISLDGPQALHDRHRVTRKGSGTYAKAIAGLRLLQKFGVSHNVISVITEDSLSCPDDLYDFYVEHGIRNVGLNIEEIEGPHTESVVLDKESAYARFLKRLMERSEADRKVRIRDFEKIKLLAFSTDALWANCENHPYSLITVAVNGDVTTFSPELAGNKNASYGNFVIANVHKGLITERSEAFDRLYADIQAGVRKCRESCEYFALCGGGNPSNKYFENGSVATAETKYCRLSKKLMAETVISFHEKLFDMSAAANS